MNAPPVLGDPQWMSIGDVGLLAEEAITWAESCNDLGPVEDFWIKLSQTEAYLRSNEGPWREIARACRSIEARIGVLLGEAEVGGSSAKRARPQSQISTQRRHDFRVVAQHRDHPLVSRAIRDGETRWAVTELAKAAKAADPRVGRARQMADSGCNTHQIRKALGLSPDGWNQFRKRHSIEVPADKVTGRAHVVDSMRVVDKTAHALAGIAMSLDLVDVSSLDPEALPSLVESLTDSLRDINRFHRTMKKVCHG